jgi:hypothetical protein
MGVRNLPNWLPYAMMALVAVGVLLWLGRIEVRVRIERERSLTPDLDTLQDARPMRSDPIATDCTAPI